MPDRADGIAPLVSDPNPAFRETFLTYFEPEDAAAFRRVGEVVDSMLFEGRPRYVGAQGEQELTAIAADLAHTARGLAEVGRYRAENVLADREHELSRRAEEWAAAIRAVEAEIRAAVQSEDGAP